MTTSAQGASAAINLLVAAIKSEQNELTEEEIAEIANLDIQSQAMINHMVHFPHMETEVEYPPTVRELRKKANLTLKAGLAHVIIELNDDYEWTREEIADWLETLDLDLTVRSQNEHNDGD